MTSHVGWTTNVIGRAARFGAGVRLGRAGLAVVALALLAAGCASGPRGGSTIGQMPPPDARSAPLPSQGDYLIGPLDTLDIAVFEVENLTRTVQVDTAGQIDFPLLGPVMAAGKTARELADEMSQRLGRRYLQAPYVSVFVKQSVSRKFTVEGAVSRPGVFDIVGSMSLLQAIATAQGADPAANIRHIVVFRTVDQRRMAAVADLAEIRTGKAPDPEIYPGDVIVVPSSGSKRVLRGIMGATPLFTLFGLRP